MAIVMVASLAVSFAVMVVVDVVVDGSTETNMSVSEVLGVTVVTDVRH